MSKGRSPKDFISDYCWNVGADFELWLENLNNYLVICEVSDSGEKKRFFSEFSWPRSKTYCQRSCCAHEW